MLSKYHQLAHEREELGIPPLPLNAEQTNCITKLLEQELFVLEDLDDIWVPAHLAPP